MTIEEKSNQCAFPADARTMTDGGMTLREYFAAKALQGLMVQSIPGTHNQNAENWNMERANFAVDMADALIRALAEKK